MLTKAMAFWRQEKPFHPPSPADEEVPSIVRGSWDKCAACGNLVPASEAVQNLRVCHQCHHHHPLPTAERIAAMLDKDSWKECDLDLKSGDPLHFHDVVSYRHRLEKAQKLLGTRDGFAAGMGQMGGQVVSVGFFVFEFMGGSMGSLVGEKVCRVFERAVERQVPAVIFSASGGARMQEGPLSLMQLVRTTAARKRLRAARLPYISVCLHPTTGGVAASFAMLGDVILTEPGALIGFAGPRVIRQTIGHDLPAGFQSAEFLLEHGMVDRIIHRHELREMIIRLLRMLYSSRKSSS